MTAVLDERPAESRCAGCGADRSGCGIKKWLSGRRCCASCDHHTNETRTG